MWDVMAALSTNLFRTLIIKKFISIFFTKETENKGKEKFIYFLFYFITTAVYLAFHFPPANIAVNLLMIYIIAQTLYEGEQIKKILVSILIYGINMACDIVSIYSFSDYIVGGGYNEIAAYITVLMISICEFIIERFVFKKRGMDFTPPHWNILINTCHKHCNAVLFIDEQSQESDGPHSGQRRDLIYQYADILFI